MRTVRNSDDANERNSTGLEIRKHRPVSTAVVVRDTPWSISAVHREIFTSSGIQNALRRAINDLAAGRTRAELHQLLEDLGVDALEGAYADRVVDVARGDMEAIATLMEYTRDLGTGHSSLGPGFSSPTEDIRRGALPLLRESDVTPTVAVVIDREFRETRADQRDAVLSFLVDLARSCDVSLIAESPIDRMFLYNFHREQLPPSVRNECNPRRESGPLSEIIDGAVTALDPDGRDVRVLREIGDEPSGTLAYSALYAESHVDKSRVRQCLSRLADLGLVESYGSQNNRRVEILEAGRRLLETFDSKIGRQRRLDEAVSETGNSYLQDRVTPRLGCPPAEGEPYRTTYLDRPNHAAAAACGSTTDVTLVKDGRELAETGSTERAKYVSYGPNRDEAVIAVRATGPLQYAVSVATALASPRFLDRALPVDRLETIDVPAGILRGARNIGALSDDALANGQTLRDNLVEWGQTIEDLTTKFHDGDCDDDGDLRSRILCLSHGLAGSIVHLLDVLDVDLVREIRVPRGLSSDQLDNLATSIAISAAIQSAYGAFASYRQLFDVPSCDAPRLSPEVDADEPTGSLIGSFVLRGPDVHRLRSPLDDSLSTPRALSPDGSEFDVEITIRDAPGRDAYQDVASRILSTKRIRSTPESVSLLHTLAGTPHAAAQALQQLQAEDRTQTIRADELRYALATLDADALLPECSPTVGKVVAALLAADAPLTQRDLADRADVSARSIRDHRETLEALGLLSVDDGRYRLALSFRTADERRTEALPDPLTVEWYGTADVLDPVLLERLPPERYGDLEDPIGGVLFDTPASPSDPWDLADHPEYGPWVRLSGALAGEDPPGATPESVRMGPSIEQQPLSPSRSASTGRS